MKRIISLLLTLTLMFSSLAVTVSAAKNEEYLSEIALIYEDSVEDAKKAIEGTDWKLFEQDLNANADYMFDNGVYLIYKTSTNVEDAITDLRVMDMYGGYSVSNYKAQLEASRQQYTEMVQQLRRAVTEFKTLYAAGDEMAKLAYRQMNYYKDTQTTGGTETGMLMGDFFLNMPSDDKVVQVLLEGNKIIVGNLVSLIAIGISGEDDASLASKVAQYYAIKDTLSHEDYYESAQELSTELSEIRAKLLRYDALSDEYDLDDEEVSEEESVFMTENATLAMLLEEIKLGETTLADLLRGGTWTAQDLYPIVAAFSEGQKAMIAMGQLETVLKYNAPSKPIEELNKMLDGAEETMKDANGNFQPIDVYLGVDRSIFKGTFAMTNAAQRQQALTGETWDLGEAAFDSIPVYIGAGILVLGDVVLGLAIREINLTFAELLAEEAAASTAGKTGVLYDAMWARKSFEETLITKMPYLKATAVGVALIVVGIVGISTWYNYYNPDYTDIPNVLIDVRETDLGDKYIKYTAAKVFDEENMNADFNAYEGKEWIALYYTKDATAGSCLTPNFVFSENNSTIARRHQGISMFGETTAFNLNSHVYSSNAKGAYVTVRYSTTKKAAANIPTVVGSMFATGAFYAVAALAGAGVGVGGTLLLQKAKKKKELPECNTAE